MRAQVRAECVEHAHRAVRRAERHHVRAQRVDGVHAHMPDSDLVKMANERDILHALSHVHFIQYIFMA